jgi:peptide-methionine (S)-S-oxide reductase
MKYIHILLVLTLSFFTSCAQSKKDKRAAAEYVMKPNEKMAVFASGCFWCVEAIFESVEGVNEVISGYCGDKKELANYDLVSNAYTKHAESVAVYYDSSKVSYQTLLRVFFGSHDPTTLNRQGPDVGKQYRSAIFYNNEEEKKQIETYIDQLYKEGVFKFGTITTEVSKLTGFYNAEVYHQDFERKNPDNPYVQAVSVPRLNMFKTKFPELLKKSSASH